MKKLILFITLLSIFAFGVNAQNAYIDKGGSFVKYTGAASDTITESDTTFVLNVTNPQNYPLLHDVKVSLDSVSGTPTADIKLKGKLFSGDDYTTISTVSWAGTSSDTTFTITEHSTAKYYRYYRVYIDADSGTTQKFKVDEIKTKFWYKP